MFEHKPPTSASAISGSASGGKPAASKQEAAVADYVIHSLPKEFYDRPIHVYPQDKPNPSAPAKAILPAIPAPAKAGVLLPLNRGPVVAKPRVLVPPKKSRKTLVLVLVALVFVAVSVTLILAYSLGWFKPSAPATDIPIETPVAKPEPEPVVVPELAPPKITPGIDTDSDGLTNVEELMYGTDFRNPDSDGDTYLDGNEVFHRYNPMAAAPSTLLATGAVRVLDSLDLPFSMSYPTSWNPISQPAAQRVSFRADSGALVSVLWQTKGSEISLADWYINQVGEVSLDRLQSTLTKEGYPALIGPDERVMYLEAAENVYTLIYELGALGNVEFLQTFKMMANSFRLTL